VPLLAELGAKNELLSDEFVFLNGWSRQIKFKEFWQGWPIFEYRKFSPLREASANMVVGRCFFFL